MAASAGLPAKIAQVGRVNYEVAGERATQRLVGGDEGSQPLVDLAIVTLPPLPESSA